MQSQTREQQAAALEQDWSTNPRWKGIKRSYSAADVVRLRGSVQIEHTLARAAPRSCGTWSTPSPSSTRSAP
jgi:isocitrate lyase